MAKKEKLDEAQLSLQLMKRLGHLPQDKHRLAAYRIIYFKVLQSQPFFKKLEKTIAANLAVKAAEAHAIRESAFRARYYKLRDRYGERFYNLNELEQIISSEFPSQTFNSSLASTELYQFLQKHVRKTPLKKAYAELSRAISTHEGSILTRYEPGQYLEQFYRFSRRKK